MVDIISFRVVVFREADQWVAQCLERDVCVQAMDLDTLSSRLDVALNLEEDLESVPPAPEYFFRQWDKCSDFHHKGATDGGNYEMALCA